MAYKAHWAEDTSKLNKTELLKLEKDGLDVIRTIIEKYAVEGFDSIPEDEKGRFKWAGVYEQKPKDGYFMMRVRIPTGILTSEQARAISSIARDYGRNLIDVTTRQAIQYHWLQIEDFPDIFERLERVGLYSFEACGDCPRTITGNPLAGIDPNELMDTTEIVNEINDFFLMNKDFSNLPRKFKMMISANVYNSSNAEINDLAFTPATFTDENGEKIVGFHVWVGGGLSARPHFAQKLSIFIRPEEVKKVSIGVATLFRDFGYREKRTRARLKFLVADWGVEKFQEELLKVIGEMPIGGQCELKGWDSAYCDGVHPQKQEGYSYIGLNVPIGRTNSDEFDELARIAEQYGDGTIRTTISQNVVLTGIKNENVQHVLKEKVLERLSPNPNRFMSRMVSCTGNEFCNLALVETKKRAYDTAIYLDQKIDLDEPVRIHMIGCPNSCGQKHIADIGLQGSLIRTPEGMADAFDLFVGGTLGEKPEFNHKLKGRVQGNDVPYVLEQLILFFKENRSVEETFNQFVHRVGVDAFQEKLSEITEAIKTA